MGIKDSVPWEGCTQSWRGAADGQARAPDPSPQTLALLQPSGARVPGAWRWSRSGSAHSTLKARSHPSGTPAPCSLLLAHPPSSASSKDPGDDAGPPANPGSSPPDPRLSHICEALQGRSQGPRLWVPSSAFPWEKSESFGRLEASTRGGG